MAGWHDCSGVWEEVSNMATTDVEKQSHIRCFQVRETTYLSGETHPQSIGG
jgi:hypothetical protein